jgi:hypothetical protein
MAGSAALTGDTKAKKTTRRSDYPVGLSWLTDLSSAIWIVPTPVNRSKSANVAAQSSIFYGRLIVLAATEESQLLL